MRRQNRHGMILIGLLAGFAARAPADADTPDRAPAVLRTFVQPSACGRYPERIVVRAGMPAGTAAAPPIRERAVANRLLVRPQAGVEPHAVREFAQRNGDRLIRRLRGCNLFLIGFEAVNAETLDAKILAYADRTNRFAYAGPDRVLTLADTPNDPYFTSGQLWGHTKTDVPSAWTINHGTGEWVVAVADTGIDVDHPDLAANLWTNPGETGPDGSGGDKASNGIDDDLNGYIDDVHGWDFAYEDNDPDDGHGHGTRCSGTIGAAGNNGIGVVGVGWHIPVLPIKIYTDDGSSTESDVIEGFHYLVTLSEAGHRIAAVNCSWSFTGYSSPIADAVQALGNAGILCVASTGNSGIDVDAGPVYPACLPHDNVLSVMGSDSFDSRYGNYGATTVDLAAPGVGIVSTDKNATYSTHTGTSRSAPYVAGAAALLWDAFSAMTPLQVRHLILDGTDSLAAFEGRCVTGGRLNIGRSMTAAVELNRRPPGTVFFFQ